MYSHRLLLLVSAAVLFLLSAQEIAAQQVTATEHTLDNGLHLLIVERPGDPAVAAGWVARVGSVNEAPGTTGIAHLFEHMLFKGTHTIGTRDLGADLRILAQKDSVRALMRREESLLRQQQRRGEIGDPSDPSVWPERYRELRSEFNRLIEAQREVIIKDEIDRIYSNAGATGLNAFTSHDVTFYFINVPANKLELFFWMESDRLLNPVFREFYAERDVVREERRMRTESTPTGRFDETFEAMFYTSHPYGWPIVGWPSDVENITREQANAFFDIYYGPNNLTFVVVGDVDPDEVIAMSERYLGRLPATDRLPPEVITTEIPQQAEKRMVAYAETNPTVRVRFHTVPFNHRDSFALDVLAGVLSGRTGRMHRDLVLDKEMAAQAGAFQSSRQYAGYFQFTAVAREEYTPEQLEQEIYEHIEMLQREPVTEREIQRVKNQSIANSYRRLSSNYYLMVQLGMYQAMDSWQYINEESEKILAVTPEDIQRVAQTYFGPEQRNVAIYYTKTEDQQ